jgi:DNA-binding transcriptional regulator YhcF (GntR family)
MPVRHDDLRPPYLQVSADLRSKIAGGQLQPGQRLPSIRELAEQYEVAPMTIQNALGVLRDEALVATVQGRGVFVADPLPATLDKKPTSSRSRVAKVENLPPPTEDPRIDELQRQVDTLRAQVMELYGLLGYPRPDEEPAQPKPKSRRRRHA